MSLPSLRDIARSCSAARSSTPASPETALGTPTRGFGGSAAASSVKPIHVGRMLLMGRLPHVLCLSARSLTLRKAFEVVVKLSLT
jgi:hypothetical protein